jgi:hypothetical protein
MQVAQINTGGEGSAMAGFGDTLMNLGAREKALALQEKEKLDATEAQSAINALRQKQLDLTAGEPDDKGNIGYVKIKGENAIHTPDGGKPFLDTYREKFTSARNDIGTKLGGPAKKLFDQHAEAMSIDFQSGLLKHHAGELGEYNKAVAFNTLELNTAAARADWNNPAKLAVLEANTRNALERYLDYTGTPDKEAVAQQSLAKFHDGVIDGALAAGQPEKASAYLKKNKDKLGNFLLPLTEKVDHARQMYATAAVVAAVERRYAQDVAPSPAKQAFNVIDLVKGEGAPPGDMKAFSADLKAFDGNVLMAFAAQFGGADVVKESVSRAEKSAKLAANDPAVPRMSWLDALPKEVRAKALKAREAYESGYGAKEPTLMEFKNAAVSVLKNTYPDVTPGMLNAAAAGAEAKFHDMMANRNDQRDRVMVNLQRRIDSGDVKSFESITPTEKMMLGTSSQAVRNYIEAKGKADDRLLESSPAAMQAYENLRLNADELVKPGAIKDIMGLADHIGIKRVNQLLTQREQYLSDPTSLGKASVDSDLFAAETQALKGNTKELQVKRALLMDRVKEVIRNEPVPPSNARIREIIQGQLIEIPKVDKGEGWFGRKTGSAMTFETTTDKIIISPEDAKTVRAVAAQLGHPIAEGDDAGLKAAYLGMLKQQQLKAKK